jgi:hypothetical protein
MTFTKCWCEYDQDSHTNSTPTSNDPWGFVFANRSEESNIHPLTIREIAEVQKSDKTMKTLKLKEKYENCLVETTELLCKMASLLSQNLSRRSLLHGIITIFSTLDIQGSKRP